MVKSMIEKKERITKTIPSRPGCLFLFIWTALSRYHVAALLVMEEILMKRTSTISARVQ